MLFRHEAEGGGKAGDQLPQLSLPSTGGRMVDLRKEAEVHHLVLFFYPGDREGLRYAELAGCTAEACAFRDSLALFRQMGAVVYGVSLQPVERQREFVEREHLTFELLSDREEALVGALFIPVWESAAGERFAVRTTAVVARGGTVARRFAEVQPEVHVPEVLEVVRRLPSL